MHEKSNLSHNSNALGTESVIAKRVHQGVAYLSLARSKLSCETQHQEHSDLGASILENLLEADKDPEILVICLHSACADIWGDLYSVPQGAPKTRVTLLNFCASLEAIRTPTVVAAFGTISGARMAMALSAHYRIADAASHFVVPDVALGCVPEGGITQRLPRLIGPHAALAMCLDEKVVKGSKVQNVGMANAVFKTLSKTIIERYCEGLIATEARAAPTCDLTDKLEDGAGYLAALSARREGSNSTQLQAAKVILHCLEAALLMPFEAGILREEAAASEAKASDQSRSLQYARQAEKHCMSAPNGVDLQLGAPINQIGILGTSTFALGLAQLVLDHGLKVHVVADDPTKAILAVRKLTQAYTQYAQQGKVSAQVQEERLANLTVSAVIGKFAQCDFVIDATTEPLKKHIQTIERLEHALPQHIGLAVIRVAGFGQLSKGMRYPERFLGLHFFDANPSGKCVELVTPQSLSPALHASAYMLLRTLKKMPVQVAAHDGLIAQPIQNVVWEAVDVMLLMGVRPSQIDRAMREYGLQTGPCEQMDRIGLNRFRGVAAELLNEVGDTGLSAQRGFFTYLESGKGGHDDEISYGLITQLREQAGIASVLMSDQEICERVLLAQANAGARLLQDGTAEYPIDIDAVMLFAKGAPRRKGGPMFEADKMGALAVYNKLRSLAQAAPDIWSPEPLWAELMKNGDKLSDLDAL